MMRRETDRLGRCAAALQCIAEEFREFAALDSGARDVELHRFAEMLDHMAASLMVPASLAAARVISLPPPDSRAIASDADPSERRH
jgi:hypothetical protein